MVYMWLMIIQGLSIWALTMTRVNLPLKAFGDGGIHWEYLRFRTQNAYTSTAMAVEVTDRIDVFFANPFWRKLQNIFGGCCTSKKEENADDPCGLIFLQSERDSGQSGHIFRSLSDAIDGQQLS